MRGELQRTLNAAAAGGREVERDEQHLHGAPIVLTLPSCTSYDPEPARRPRGRARPPRRGPRRSPRVCARSQARAGRAPRRRRPRARARRPRRDGYAAGQLSLRGAGGVVAWAPGSSPVLPQRTSLALVARTRVRGRLVPGSAAAARPAGRRAGRSLRPRLDGEARGGRVSRPPARRSRLDPGRPARPPLGAARARPRLPDAFPAPAAELLRRRRRDGRARGGARDERRALPAARRLPDRARGLGLRDAGARRRLRGRAVVALAAGDADARGGRARASTRSASRSRTSARSGGSSAVSRRARRSRGRRGSRSCGRSGSGRASRGARSPGRGTSPARRSTRCCAARRGRSRRRSRRRSCSPRSRPRRATGRCATAAPTISTPGPRSRVRLYGTFRDPRASARRIAELRAARQGGLERHVPRRRQPGLRRDRAADEHPPLLRLERARADAGDALRAGDGHLPRARPVAGAPRATAAAC